MCCSRSVYRVGYRNRFHHPNPGVFERYQGRHIELTRSDVDGAVQIMAADNLAAAVRAQGTLAAATSAQSNAAQDTPSPPATLTLERYRTAYHRYWMDR